MSRSLAGKVLLLTGAAGGQGRLKRIATPEEIARTALFLASHAASYIAGAELIVDGEFSA